MKGVDVYIKQLAMGAVLVVTTQHADDRGSLTETFRSDHLQEASGVDHRWVQSNLSVNRAGVFRGVHFSTSEAGQAKYVTCVRGALYDFAVDLRHGSPTFGNTVTVFLAQGESLYVPEGFGHGFVTVSDETIVSYLLSSPHNPDTEHTVSYVGVFAPQEKASHYGLKDDLIVSARDAAAPVLADHMASGGVLPRYRGR